LRFNRIKRAPSLLSPRGEFADASFKIKFIRKYLFVKFVQFFRLYSTTNWHVSSDNEMIDLESKMKIKSHLISQAIDLPSIININQSVNLDLTSKDFRIIFLSRIAIEKNLDIAITILSKLKVEVLFDIYGMVADKKYWEKCKKMIDSLPSNITVSYCGVVDPSEVGIIFSKYDLFLFPTGGENYGHVIAESLSVGTKVLISKNTPWVDLEEKGVGWDFDLNDKKSFVKIIELMTELTIDVRKNARAKVVENFNKMLADSNALEINRSLYN
jgi:glycosyltransferase involved in cell wall biosynthesis